MEFLLVCLFVCLFCFVLFFEPRARKSQHSYDYLVFHKNLQILYSGMLHKIIDKKSKFWILARSLKLQFERITDNEEVHF